MLADRLKIIKDSPTLALTKLIAELKANGENIIDFGVGEPSFQTPKHVCESGIKAINSGMTKYTAVDGTISLRKAICSKLNRENELDYSHNEVIVGTGAKQVIFNAMMATLNRDDEVIIPAPYWVSYPDMVQLAEGKPVIVECLQENNFKMMPNQLESAITDRTKWLILNSPSNPTGMIYSEEELKEIGRILKKYPNVWLLTDDIYEHLIYDDLRFTTMLNVVPELKSRTLIVNGVSKSHSMTGWRIGYGVGPQILIKNMSKIQSHSTSNPCTISQYAAEEGLNHDMKFFEDWKKKYINRRNLAFDILSSSEFLKIVKPNGAFYIFVNCEGCINKTTIDGKFLSNDSDVSEYLLKRAKVGVVPGSAFGLSPYFRISYVAEEETVERGCKQIVEAIKELR